MASIVTTVKWFLGVKPVTEKEREVVRGLLRDASIHEVSEHDTYSLVTALRKGNMSLVQAELVEVGIKLSAVPPTAYELRRRYSRLCYCEK